MGIEIIHYQCDSLGLWKGLINPSPDFVSPSYRFMIISLRIFANSEHLILSIVNTYFCQL